MIRLLKILGIAIAVTLVLAVVAVVVIPLVFDPNDYRDKIAAMIEQRTGRTASIDGELTISVLPWLGVETGAMSLGNAPGFGDAPFAQIDAV